MEQKPSIPARSSSRSPTKGIPLRTTSRSPVKGIPPRTSSLSPSKRRLSPEPSLEQLRREREDVNVLVKHAKKKLKASASIDAEYWARRLDFTDKSLRAHRLTTKISATELTMRTEDYLMSEEGQNLRIQGKSLDLDKQIFQAQYDKWQAVSRSEESVMRQSFTSLFMGAPTGWGIKNYRGQRDNTLQSAFRRDLEARMKSIHPDYPKHEKVWCPVTAQWWPRTSTQAGHLFPSSAGQDHMDAIFGTIRDKEGKGELFKAENGILWSTDTEIRFSKGFFTIVPDIVDEPTPQQVDAWNNSEPKEYKVRVLDFKAPAMQANIYGSEVSWVDLDNRPLSFNSNFRPRARYLYFAYCEKMLRQIFAGGEDHLQVTKSEAGKKYWGTPGRYMLKGMLRGFVDQMGHDYDHLMQGAIPEEEEAEIDFDGLSVANAHMREGLREDKEDEDEEEDDSSDEED